MRLAALAAVAALAVSPLFSSQASAYACPPLFEYHTYTVGPASVNWCRFAPVHCDPGPCDFLPGDR